MGGVPAHGTSRRETGEKSRRRNNGRYRRRHCHLTTLKRISEIYVDLDYFKGMG